MREEKRLLKRGFTLMEVLVSLAIMAIVVASLFPIINWLISRSTYLQYDAQASLLLQEGMEVSYNVMISDWTNFYTNYPDGVYHPAIDMTSDPDKWMLLPGLETDLEARFTRQISIESVCRNDMTGERVTGSCGSGSTIDHNSKLVTTTVTWKEQQKDKTIKTDLLVTNLAR